VATWSASGTPGRKVNSAAPATWQRAAAFNANRSQPSLSNGVTPTRLGTIATAARGLPVRIAGPVALKCIDLCVIPSLANCPSNTLGEQYAGAEIVNLAFTTKRSGLEKRKLSYS
jgi:hypothetical protein